MPCHALEAQPGCLFVRYLGKSRSRRPSRCFIARFEAAAHGLTDEPKSGRMRVWCRCGSGQRRRRESNPLKTVDHRCASVPQAIAHARVIGDLLTRHRCRRQQRSRDARLAKKRRAPRGEPCSVRLARKPPQRLLYYSRSTVEAMPAASRGPTILAPATTEGISQQGV